MSATPELLTGLNGDVSLRVETLRDDVVLVLEDEMRDERFTIWPTEVPEITTLISAGQLRATDTTTAVTPCTHDTQHRTLELTHEQSDVVLELCADCWSVSM